MIKFLSNWIEQIAIAVIVVSIIEMLIPNGNIKKYIKVVLGIYVVFCMISPFVNKNDLYAIDFSNVMENYNITDNSNQTNSNTDLEKIYKNTFEDDIKRRLKREGYSVKSCNVDAVFDTDRTDAGIKKIEIVLESKIDDNNQTESNSVKDYEQSNNININEIEKVQINVGESTKEETEDKKEITQKEINKLKKTLSEHYEIDKKIIDIR